MPELAQVRNSPISTEGREKRNLTSATSQWCVNCSSGVANTLRGERADEGSKPSSSACCRVLSLSDEKPEKQKE